VNFERLLKGEQVQINGDGKQKLDYVFVADCVSALRALATNETSSEIVNISSGVSHSVESVLEQMCVVSGSRFHPRFMPADWTAGTDRVGSKDKVYSSFGWEAKVPLEQGLKEIWDWLSK
jgi:nucleoside-diphosphate-sugar epimerase